MLTRYFSSHRKILFLSIITGLIAALLWVHCNFLELPQAGNPIRYVDHGCAHLHGELF